MPSNQTRGGGHEMAGMAAMCEVTVTMTKSKDQIVHPSLPSTGMKGASVVNWLKILSGSPCGDVELIGSFNTIPVLSKTKDV